MKTVVEKCGNLRVPNGQWCGGTNKGLAACSACADDYEDLDRTAWNADEREDDDDITENAAAEELVEPILIQGSTTTGCGVFTNKPHVGERGAIRG